MPASPHPAARLVSWMALVVAVQALTGMMLPFALGLLLALAAWVAKAHLLRLVRRARILLITIGLLFVCGTPGEALLPWAGALSPTPEGLALAGEHGGRLLMVLALLALLFQFSSSADLVAGLHGLLAPFARLGLPRDKVALRLLLVLRYAEEQKGTGRIASWREWLDWLECHDGAGGGEPRMRIALRPWAWSDRLLVGAVLAGVALLFARG